MKIVCDACSAKYSIADEKVRGKVFKIRCKKCSNIIVVRGSVSEAAEPAAAKYDQKETKVLDYAGYEGQRPSDDVSEAPPGAIWHLVIDQEQVGPMTVEEVRERFRRGEVDADGYVWREGFGDWERLADVDVFAAMMSGGGARADNGGVGVLFGSGGVEAYEEARAAHSDPNDLFSARGAGDDGGAAADLFGGAGMAMGSGDASAGDTDALFAGADGGAMAAAGGKASSSSLTGLRNENSVLFSLNNLAALASDAPRAAISPSSSAPAPVASSGGSGGSGTGLPSEGSGLIDIRSMAQVYLGEGKSPGRPVGSPADLPVFSQSSFESASPVLLPSIQAGVNNRLLIALIGLIGVLVIAAVVLVIVVLKGSGGERPRLASAESETPAVRSAQSPPLPAAAAAASPAAGAAAPVGGAGAGPGPGATVSGGTPPGDPTRGSSAPGATSASVAPAVASDQGSSDRASEKDQGKDRSREKDREKDHQRDKEKDHGRDRHSDRRSESGGSHEKQPDQRATAAPPPDPTETSGCDEVTCLVEPDKPCCRKYGRRSGGSSSASSSAPVDPNLPERPSREDVASGIGKVKGNVSGCGSRAPDGGKVTVKIKISPNGTVSSAAATGGSASLNGCVEAAVSRARFPKSQFGASVNYPFLF